MFCKVCGNKLDDGDRFCKTCGSPVQGQTQNQMQNQTSNHAQNQMQSQTTSHAQNQMQSQVSNHSQNQTQNQMPNHSQNQTQNQMQNQGMNQAQAPAGMQAPGQIPYSEGVSAKPPAKKSNLGLILGIVGGAIVLLALGAALLFMLFNARKNNDRREDSYRHEDRDEDKGTPEDADQDTEEKTEAENEDEKKEAEEDKESDEEKSEKLLKNIYADYLEILDDRESEIRAYKWQQGYEAEENYPVSIADMDNDGYPELMFFEGVSEYEADLYIYKSMGDGAKKVKEFEKFDVAVAAGTNYYFWTRKDDDCLYSYNYNGDEWIYETYTKYKIEGDRLNEVEKWGCASGPDENYEKTVHEYTKDGEECDKSDFKSATDDMTGDVKQIITYSVQVKDRLGGAPRVCETYDNAEEFLEENSSDDADSEDSDKDEEGDKDSDKEGDKDAGDGEDDGDKETGKKSSSALPIDDDLELTFASGAGAWGTSITISPDGSFVGGYHDSDMGDMGDAYPNGTVYVSNFSGKFKDIEKIDDYSYKMKLDSLETEQEVGTEEIEDGILYKYTDPYGLDGGRNFILYLPGKPVSELDEEAVSWAYGVIGDISEKKTLDGYALYNKANGETFYQWVEQ